MKKKFVRAITSVILAAGLLLGGCGGTQTAGNDSSAAGSSADTKTETVQEEAKTTQDEAKIVIKAATGGSPKPYIVVEENGEIGGYDVEVLREVFARLPQYDLQIEVTEFASMFSGVASGTYQLAVNNLSYNEKRAESYLYSYPYDKVGYMFITGPDSEPIHSFEEAAGKTYEGSAGVNVTNAVEVWNEKNPDKQINITYTEAGTPVILQHIEEGSIDFAIIDLAMFDVYTKDFGLNVVGTELVSDEAKIVADNLYAYFLFPLDGNDLRTEIDAVLKDLKDDGTLEKISTKYFGKDTSPEADQYESTIN